MALRRRLSTGLLLSDVVNVHYINTANAITRLYRHVKAFKLTIIMNFSVKYHWYCPNWAAAEF